MVTYSCRKICSDICLDGNFDKEIWKSAPQMEFHENMSGCEPRQKTYAKMLWNDDYLYAAFKVMDNFINATLTDYNDRLYTEEVVEIFIDDDCDLKTYIELELNPLNAVLHYYVQNNLDGSFITFSRVDKKIESCVLRKDKEGYWSCEMKIPMEEFVTASVRPPVKGQEWHMNLYRIDRPEDGNDEYSAWSPTGILNFHIPQKFGRIVFDD